MQLRPRQRLSRALFWCKSITSQPLVVESDCLNLDGTLIRHLLLECLELVLYFQNMDFLHVQREGNSVTHELAKFSKTTVAEMSWIGPVPQCIYHCVEFDMVHV